MMHTLMREKGVHNVNTSMFSEQQRKVIYESYGEQFLMFNGLGYLVNCVVPYALAKNMNMVDKKLKQELDYALKQYDYEYAFLCAKLLNDEKMIEFVKQYDVKGRYDKIFNDMSKFVSEARK